MVKAVPIVMLQAPVQPVNLLRGEYLPLTPSVHLAKAVPMAKLIVSLALLLFTPGLGMTQRHSKATKRDPGGIMQPPVAERIPHTLQKHGDKRVDEYFWLKERENPKVVAYIEAENAYLKEILQPTEHLQERLFHELKSRIKEEDESAPYKRGDYYYLTRYEKGAEYPVYARRLHSPIGSEEVFLNVNELAKGHKYYDVGRMAISFDQKKVAYAVDTVGRRFYDLHFKDLAEDKKIPDIIKDTTGAVVWLNDNETILYSKQDPKTLRAHQIYKYTLGGRPELIYEEPDPQFFVYVSKALTQNEVYITSISNTATEVRVAAATSPDLNFKVFFPREKKHEYAVFDGGDRYFVLSNHRAKNFRLFETEKSKTDRKRWKEIVPHREKTLIENVVVFKDHVVMEERENGLTQLTWFQRGQKKRHKLKFPDPTYVASFGKNAEYDTPAFRYEYQSLTRPETTYDFDFEKQKSITVKTEEVPTYRPNLYQSERAFAKAKDGTKIPISLVYKKSLFKRSSNPLFVYAYGSYGHSTDTYFRRNVVSLLDRGFVFAIAHVRGGSEMGRAWYENGKLLKKKNTFTDFIASTEHLLNKGYGQRGRVYAMGGSAGGLLMGAIFNMRPDLYNGVIAAVPFVDVVTTMLDDSIPLTTNEYDEWGNPNDPKFYKYIKSYSPYDNVKKQRYPNLLITTGFHDSQVQYWEPAKWIAKLRTHNTGPNLLLMKTDMDAGHSGTTGRFESLKETALDYAFVLMLENIDR